MTAATLPVGQAPAPPDAARLAATGQAWRPINLDAETRHWARALEAAERALRMSASCWSGAELGRRQRALDAERAELAATLGRLADAYSLRPRPWLSPTSLSPQMLGLAPTVKACLFDLEGVLTDSGLVHAAAWAEVFDAFLLLFAARTGWHFIPFDRGKDYRTYLDGRPRLEGVHAFLDSRGIRLPEGDPDDPPELDTVNGLARRKSDALVHVLRRRGVSALTGARRYLEAAGQAGLVRAAVSSSANAILILERGGLATLVDECVDAEVIRREGLRSRPAPDLVLSGCRRLGVHTHDAVTLTHTPAGVAASRAAGVAVIGVCEQERDELLSALGPGPVVPSLRALLDPRLAFGAVERSQPAYA
jgi:beta-phosphoglucomutase-like phosphatase (HAD superfamily)